MYFRVVGLLFCLSLLLPGQTAPWPTRGWAIATPESQGLDSTRLDQAAAYIASFNPTRYSLLVIRNGYLVYERYYRGSSAAQTNNIKSMSKSVLSVLTGIALQEGRLRGLDQKLSEFYPEYFGPSLDARKREITLKHILTMSAGFQWAENTSNSDRLWASRNWLQTKIEWPMATAPGVVFNYDTGLTHLLSGILTRVSGASTLAYANSRLFGPLGISCNRWTQDPMGIYFGGSEVWLTARDLAKFGYLVLRNGQWEDREIVPEPWLRESTRIQVRNGMGWPMGDYGYLWWSKPQQGYPVILASGYGGQYVFLVPDLDLMVVTTADSTFANENTNVYSQPFDVLWSYIIPAVTGAAPSITAGGVVQAADYGTVAAPGSFASVFGEGLSLVERTWDYAMPADGKLPMSVGGVRVNVNGTPAAVSYAGPKQVNFLVPPGATPGKLSVVVQTARGNAFGELQVEEAAPAWFPTERRRVQPGAVIEMYASGLGRTIPATPAAVVIATPLVLAEPPEVFVAGRPAIVEWYCLVYAGVYQLNVRVPADTPAGEAHIQLRAGGRTATVDAVVDVVP